MKALLFFTDKNYEISNSPDCDFAGFGISNNYYVEIIIKENEKYILFEYLKELEDVESQNNINLEVIKARVRNIEGNYKIYIHSSLAEINIKKELIKNGITEDKIFFYHHTDKIFSYLKIIKSNYNKSSAQAKKDIEDAFDKLWNYEEARAYDLATIIHNITNKLSPIYTELDRIQKEKREENLIQEKDKINSVINNIKCDVENLKKCNIDVNKVDEIIRILNQINNENIKDPSKLLDNLNELNTLLNSLYS